MLQFRCSNMNVGHKVTNAKFFVFYSAALLLLVQLRTHEPRDVLRFFLSSLAALND